jgi:hypothetical protein
MAINTAIRFEVAKTSVIKDSLGIPVSKPRRWTVLAGSTAPMMWPRARKTRSSTSPGSGSYYGANFQMNPGAPVSVDLSPLIGYRITNLWTIGTGGSVRYRLDPKDDFRLPNGGNIVYGFLAFSQCRAIKSFYFHAEWEFFNKPFTSTT